MNLKSSGDHMPRSATPQSIERVEKNLHNPLPPPRARKPYYVTCKRLRSQSDEIVASHMSTSTRRRPGWETGLARKAVAENLVQSGYGGTDGRAKMIAGLQQQTLDSPFIAMNDSHTSVCTHDMAPMAPH